jgi:D-alanyl-D-alanine carboxypeptidase/D-alanyl-D-alanine-endopeptidase (penicillin-binding protein 4)
MPARPRPRSRAALAAASVLLALTFATAPAEAQEPTTSAPAAPGTTVPVLRVGTPLLSARRVPNLLRAPIADAQLAASVDDIVSEAPTTSCLSVASGGRPVFDHNETIPVEPASANKILTSYAILQKADPQERLTTTAVAASAPEGGVVRGDLFIVGGGDAMLNTPGYTASFEYPEQPVNDPAALADRIEAAGITEITGNIVGDDSRYDEQRSVSTWPDRYRREDTVGSLGALMVNHGVTGYADSPERASGTRMPGDPPLLAAETIETMLEQRGIRVGGAPTTGRAPAQSTEVARLESAPLGEIVTETLSWSDNTTAELLTKELGLRATGTGSTAAGTQATRDALAAGGFPIDGLVINDGSGLDVANRLTCQLLVDVLDAEGPDSVIGQGMAIAGQRGTLRKRLRGTEVEGKVIAKTGTLTTPPVSSLAGFVTTRTGEVVTFAFVQNGPDTDASLADQLALALYEFPQAPTIEVLGPKPPTGA